MFPAVFQHLRDYGSFNMHMADIGPTQCDRRLEAEEGVLDAVAHTPGLNTSRLTIQQSMVWRILHEQGLHPYHVQRVRALHAEDLPQ